MGKKKDSTDSSFEFGNARIGMHTLDEVDCCVGATQHQPLNLILGLRVY